MKLFTNLRGKLKDHPRLSFALWVLAFYLLMVILYLYLMNANLSTAPKFIYAQF